MHFYRVLVLGSGAGVILGWFGHFREVVLVGPLLVCLCDECWPSDLIWPARSDEFFDNPQNQLESVL